jgi:la-related protein 1
VFLFFFISKALLKPMSLHDFTKNLHPAPIPTINPWLNAAKSLSKSKDTSRAETKADLANENNDIFKKKYDNNVEVLSKKKKDNQNNKNNIDTNNIRRVKQHMKHSHPKNRNIIDDVTETTIGIQSLEIDSKNHSENYNKNYNYAKKRKSRLNKSSFNFNHTHNNSRNNSYNKDFLNNSTSQQVQFIPNINNQNYIHPIHNDRNYNIPSFSTNFENSYLSFNDRMGSSPVLNSPPLAERPTIPTIVQQHENISAIIPPFHYYPMEQYPMQTIPISPMFYYGPGMTDNKEYYESRGTGFRFGQDQAKKERSRSEGGLVARSEISSRIGSISYGMPIARSFLNQNENNNINKNSNNNIKNDEKFDRLRNQIKFYFSVDNLCKDMYLRKQMDKQGYIPVQLIRGFSRVKVLSEGNFVLFDKVIESIEEIDKKRDEEGRIIEVRIKKGGEKWILK